MNENLINYINNITEFHPMDYYVHIMSLPSSEAKDMALLFDMKYGNKNKFAKKLIEIIQTQKTIS